MVFKRTRRSFKRKPKRFFRKSRKGYRSKFRSTVVNTRVKGRTIGKNTTVKLKYVKEWDCAVNANETWASAGSNLYGRTYPIAGENSSIVTCGAHFCTPLGTSGTFGPYIKESFPSGLNQYSSFYSTAICYGSKISITIQQVATENTLRYVLVPISNKSIADRRNPNSTSNTVRALLDSLEYSDIIALPNSKYGYIRSGNSGLTRISAYASTKRILGLKDVKDNDDLTMTLPDMNADLPNPMFNASNFSLSESLTGFVWYFKIFNRGTGTTGVGSFVMTCTYYVMLKDRRELKQLTTVDPE